MQAYLPHSTTLPTRPVRHRSTIPESLTNSPQAPTRHGFAITRLRLRLSIALVAVALSLALVGSGYGALYGNASVGNSHPTARQVLESVRQKIVPAENAAATYGVRFNADGYQTLLSWQSEYQVNQAQASAFEALDLTLPCCGFGHPSADETKNCGCGHHQALYGLSKRLLAQGYDQKAAQAEASRWAAYFYPRESLEAALSQGASSDPAMQQALDELRQKGGC